MNTKSFSPMGSMHPVLFLAGMYVVALFLAIFICSSLFYSCNASSSPTVKKEQVIPPAALENKGMALR